MTFVSETMYINGKEIMSSNRMPVINPAFTKEVVGEIFVGDKSDVDEAVEAAYAAWPKWAAISVHERAGYLNQIADEIEKNCDEWAPLLVNEHGEVLSEAKADLLSGVHTLRYTSSLADLLAKEEVFEDTRGKVVLVRQPVGVSSIIVPWNYPIILCCGMLAPTLLAGNCAVVKPASYVPLTLTKVLKSAAKILPDGVLNVVLGSGGTVGDAMVTHSKVRKVAFTGSTEVGRSVIRNAAETVKNVSMELGGNDAAIILEDAKIDDRLINEFMKGIFTSSGQICYNIKRVYVSQNHYDEFVDRFIKAVDTMKVGPGLNSHSMMGPLNNKQQYDNVKQLFNQSKSKGLTVKELGSFVEEIKGDEGYYIRPTVVLDAKQTDDIVQKEQFGPIIPIIPFTDEEQAITYANDTEFGLGNSVWTLDEERGFQLARKLQSGNVFINVHRAGVSAADMPFGGFKQSGIGRVHGLEGLYEHTELQALIRRDDM